MCNNIVLISAEGIEGNLTPEIDALTGGGELNTDHIWWMQGVREETNLLQQLIHRENCTNNN